MKSKDEKSAIQVGAVIIYDKVLAGKRAKELCDRLQSRLGPLYALNLSVWNMAWLQNSALARLAAEAATHVDLLVVAIDGDKSLPPFVRSWFSRVAHHACVADGAIVAQFNSILRMEHEFAPAYAELKRIAHEAGMSFFSQVVEWTVYDLDDCINEIHKHANMRMTVLDAFFSVAPIVSLKSR